MRRRGMGRGEGRRNDVFIEFTGSVSGCSSAPLHALNELDLMTFLWLPLSPEKQVDRDLFGFCPCSGLSNRWALSN